MLTEGARRYDLVVDAARHIVASEGTEIGLTSREFEILLALYEHPGWALNADQLSSSSGPEDYASPWAVDVHIAHIRRKLRDAGCAEVIETVRGVGYRYRGPQCDPKPVGKRTGDAFIGRIREFDMLTSSLGSAVRGDARIVLLRGAAGIGKTRLAEEFARACETKAFVAWGRTESVEAPRYWVWRQVLRAVASACDGRGVTGLVGRLRPPIEDVIDEMSAPEAHSDPMLTEGRFALFDAVSRLVVEVSRHHPLVFIFDDLHRASEPSLMLLDYFSRHMDDARILLVGLYGQDLLSQASREVLCRMMTMRACTCSPLEGLSAKDVEAFFAVVGHKLVPRPLIQAVIDLTDGHPFYVLQLAHMIVDSGGIQAFGDGDLSALVPTPHLREVVRGRLGGLSKECRRLLEIAATSNDPVSVETLRRATGRPRSDVRALLDEALGAGFLDTSRVAASYRFSHEIVRAVLRFEARRAGSGRASPRVSSEMTN